MSMSGQAHRVVAIFFKWNLFPSLSVFSPLIVLPLTSFKINFLKYVCRKLIISKSF